MTRVLKWLVMPCAMFLLLGTVALANHGDPNTHVASALATLESISAKPSIQVKVDAAEAELRQAQADLAGWGPLSTTPPPTTPPPTTPPPPPPGECVGTQVPAGADLRAAMAAVTTPATFCLAAGTYEIGTTPIIPQAGDAVVGVPVTVGPNGEIDAPTKIHGTSANGVFQSPSLRAAFRVENADVSGSATTCFYHSNGFALTLRYVRVHDCLETAAGVRGLSSFEHVEIDHNGSAAFAGSSGGGIKVAFDANLTVRFAYIHDNVGDGMWWDCDVRLGTIEDSLVVRNSLSGIFVEISSGDGGGFFIRRNVVQNNNTSGAAIYAGILVVDSQNVSITDNTLGGNGRGINIYEDSRSTRGHNGCSSGFPNLNITGSGNVLNGDTSNL